MDRTRSALFSFGCIVMLTVVMLACWPVRPASAHPDKRAEGAELFSTRGCVHCHAADGSGTDSGPSLRDVRKRLPAKQISHQITDGGKSMPAFGDTLDRTQVKDLVTFLRANKWPQAPPAGGGK